MSIRIDGTYVAINKVTFAAHGKSAASSVGAGAEQTIFDKTIPLMVANRWSVYLVASTKVDAAMGANFKLRLYKGATQIFQQDLSGAIAVSINTFDYNGTTAEGCNVTTTGAATSIDSQNETYAAGDFTTAGNIKCTILNNSGGAITPAATHKFFVQIHEGT